MFLTEKKKLDYAELLKDSTLTKDKKLEYVCKLLKSYDFHGLIINYQNYKDIIEEDCYLEEIVKYSFGIQKKPLELFHPLNFIKIAFKIEDRFPSNYFSTDYKYLLKLREYRKYDVVNYILRFKY